MHTLTAERWARIEAVFHLVRDGSGDGREEALKRICEDDEGLLTDVRALLAADEQANRLRPAPVAVKLNLEGRRVGNYQLQSLRGTGGMGSVYLAHRCDGQFDRQVALKLLGANLRDKFFTERFGVERQLLATLEHSNIARLLDSGVSEEGDPYLVLEYVDGFHIDQHCDKNRLDVAARLRLFQQICDAVEYAHRKLVVHLDLKPSNVLVEKSGSIKLLDFGTAKLMGRDGQSTATLMATPSYASPEQLRGEPPTTACDIYSLGVMLFELLAGRRPTVDSAAAMLDRATNECEPERLDHAVKSKASMLRGEPENRLRAILAGDLSTIAAKCLRPLPEERYVSVSALNEDITRYLSGRPVLAQKQTILYQLKKFVRRNRGRVAAGALIVAAMVTATLVSIRAANLTSRERDRSERVTRFFEDVLNSADPSSNVQVASERKLVDVLVAASKRLSTGFADDPGIQSELHATIGRTYMGLGKMDAAQAEVTAAMAGISALNDNAKKKAYVMHVAARLDFEMGRSAAGEAKERSAIALYAQVPAAKTDPAFRAILLNNLGLFQRTQNKPEEAQQSFARALEALETLPKTPAFETGLLHHNIGALALDVGDVTTARREILLAIEKFSSLPTPPAFLASDEVYLGILNGLDGHLEKSLSLLEKAVSDALRLAGPGNPITVNARVWLDFEKSLSGDSGGLEAELTNLVELTRRPGFGGSHAAALEALGRVRMVSGHAAEAEPVLREALALRRKQPKAVYFLAESEELLGECLERQGRLADARPFYKSAADLLLKSLGPGVYATEQARRRP